MFRKILQSGVLAFVGIVFGVTSTPAAPMVTDKIILDLGSYQSGVGGEFPKWPMNKYIFNYGSMWDGHNKSDFAGLMQNTVWFFENEFSSLENSYLLTYAQNQIGEDGNLLYNPGFLANVQIANTQEEHGNQEQSLLLTNPVPEPATMLLFGTGLIGLATISRKKFRK